MPSSAKEPQCGHSAASKEEARGRLTRLTYWSVPFVILFALLNFVPNMPLPWRVVVLAVEAVFVIVYGTAAVRLSLWQRNEYWRERGRDPKRPERFPGDGPPQI